MSPDLAAALREETPAAPSELRHRVALIAAAGPRSRRVLPVGRIAMVGAAVLATGSCAIAVAVGISTAVSHTPVENASPERGGPVAAPSPASPPFAALPTVATRARMERRALRMAAPAPVQEQGRAAKLPAPSPKRAQNVTAELRLLVDDAQDLSSTTQRALRITRRLGGYVVSVYYDTPEEREGTATLRVRIPVSRVQAAVVRYSELGRILAQETQITDLQQPLDELSRTIRRLERRAAGARRAERERILAEIASLRRQRAEINRRAAFATVALDLTTHEPEKKAAPPGRFDRAVADAGGVLAAELAIGAYALIVAAPFLVLLAAAYAGSRAYRRHADQRLLERA